MGQEVPPQRTTVTPEALHAALAALWPEANYNAVAMLVAQSALETGQWHACMNFNLAGLKSDGGGMHTYYTTLERVARDVAATQQAAYPGLVELAHDDGDRFVTVRVKPRHPWCRFRAYSSLDESARGFFLLLSARYRAALDAAQAGDVGAFVHELKARGYFTAAEAPYAAGVERLWAEYSDPPMASTADVAAVLSRLGYDDVRSFQADKGLTVDGVVGPATRGALRLALATAA